MELEPWENKWLLADTHPSLHCGIAARKAIDFEQDGDLLSIRKKEKSLLSDLTGIRPGSIHFLRQVHGDTILTVPSHKATGSQVSAGEGDALITSRAGEVLVIRTADCVPVVLFDPEVPILAMVHSGWRSTRLNITGKVLDLMENRFGSKPENIHVAILPGIGPFAYEVQKDVAQHFPDHVRPSGERFLLDLPGAIAREASDKGILKHNLYITEHCTLSEKEEFFSHRGGDRGRNLNYAWFEG
jgi:hypothetical protein